MRVWCAHLPECPQAARPEQHARVGHVFLAHVQRVGARAARALRAERVAKEDALRTPLRCILRRRNIPATSAAHTRHVSTNAHMHACAQEACTQRRIQRTVCARARCRCAARATPCSRRRRRGAHKYPAQPRTDPARCGSRCPEATRSACEGVRRRLRVSVVQSGLCARRGHLRAAAWRHKRATRRAQAQSAHAAEGTRARASSSGGSTPSTSVIVYANSRGCDAYPLAHASRSHPCGSVPPGRRSTGGGRRGEA
jgi:hypothetical protein